MSVYKITGKRFVRKYTAGTLTPTYAARADAVKVAESLCKEPWSNTSPDVVATFPAHSGNDKTDGENVTNRDWFDAAIFCGEHANGMHRAFANGACYRFTLPDAAVGVSLTELKARIFSDPYNAYGARVAIFTSSSPDVPMACATCRKGSSADDSAAAQSNNGTESTPATEWYSTNTHVKGVAPRRSDGTGWFANAGAAFIRPTGGLELQKYLFVFVLLERYDVARNGYLEGSSYSAAKFDITTAAVPGWTEGAEYDCTDDVGGFGFMDVANMGFTKLFDMAGEVRYVGKASLTKNEVTHDFLMVCGDFSNQDQVSFREFVMYDLTAGRILDMSGALTANPNIKRAFDLGWKLCSVHQYLLNGNMDKEIFLSFNFDSQDPYDGRVFQAWFNVDLSSGVCSDFTSFQDVDIKGSPCGALIPTSDGVRVDKANGLVVTIGHGIDTISRNESERRIKVGDGLERAEYEGKENRDESSYTYTRTVIAYGSFDAIGDVQTGNVAKLEYKRVTGNGETYERTVQSLFGPIKVSVDNVANLMAFRISSPKDTSGIVESWLLIGEFRRINGLVCENAAIINIIEESDKAVFKNGDASAIVPLVMPQFGIALAEVERMSYGRITLTGNESSGRIYYKK